MTRADVPSSRRAAGLARRAEEDGQRGPGQSDGREGEEHGGCRRSSLAFPPKILPMTRAGAVLGTTTTGTRAYRAREEPFGRARTGEIPYHALGGSTLLSSRNLASWRLISSWAMAHGADRVRDGGRGEAA
jgi:hypothetical protein